MEGTPSCDNKIVKSLSQSSEPQKPKGTPRIMNPKRQRKMCEMGYLPGVDEVNSNSIVPKEDDLFDWKQKSLRKEKEFLIKLKLARLRLQEEGNPVGAKQMNELLGTSKSREYKNEYTSLIEEFLQPSKAKRNFVRFSQAHQGVLKYITQKNKIEKQKKEQEDQKEKKGIYKTLTKKPSRKVEDEDKVPDRYDSDSDSSQGAPDSSEKDTGTDRQKNMTYFDLGDELMKYFNLDGIDEEEGGGIFSSGSTKLNTHLSADSIQKVNEFIKKLNFEKLHIDYSLQASEAEKEMGITNIAASRRSSIKNQRRFSGFGRVDEIIKQARLIGKKEEERPESPEGAISFSFGKRSISKKKVTPINRINLQVNGGMNPDPRKEKLQSFRQSLPSLT
ncbi:unnamed protein product [Moneuplotes crassus]|uniref:Uncharacterized protein n=1 Tax=Euplotes crassus TaxID=5936 RepID=A0AAD1Y3Y5_EUPCR|nr:unnamed protein product [Moneuplotes crassus]